MLESVHGGGQGARDQPSPESLGMRLEHLVYSKAKEGKLVVVDRDADLVMAYWSLIFDPSAKAPGVSCTISSTRQRSLCLGRSWRPWCAPASSGRYTRGR